MQRVLDWILNMLEMALFKGLDALNSIPDPYQYIVIPLIIFVVLWTFLSLLKKFVKIAIVIGLCVGILIAATSLPENGSSIFTFEGISQWNI